MQEYGKDSQGFDDQPVNANMKNQNESKIVKDEIKM